MKRMILGCLVVALVLAGHDLSAQGGGVRITYLYDNTIAVEGTKADWGFACLVEGHGRVVLFDTGAQPGILRHNMAALKVDASRIQAVVLSHEHGDHTLGLEALPASSGLPVYVGQHFRLPPAANAALDGIGARRVTVGAGRSVQIFPGFTVTEEIALNNAFEEALVVDTPDGSVVIVGCAHPGIVAMLRHIAGTTKRPIHAVVGGFHLMQTPAAEVRKIIADFRSMGIAWAGPTHCTGDAAMKAFREAYGDHYISGGVGTVVELPKAR